MVMDYEIKLGWGKPVALPPTPFYVHAATAAGKRVKTGLPFNATPAVASKAGPAPMLTAQQARQQAITGATVIVVIPSDRAVRQLIHRTIEFVVREGPEFEAALMKKVEGDPKYKFLSENDCFEHTYYRWKLFSVLQVCCHGPLLSSRPLLRPILTGEYRARALFSSLVGPPLVKLVALTSLVSAVLWLVYGVLTLSLEFHSCFCQLPP